MSILYTYPGPLHYRRQIVLSNTIARNSFASAWTTTGPDSTNVLYPCTIYADSCVEILEAFIQNANVSFKRMLKRFHPKAEW